MCVTQMPAGTPAYATNILGWIKMPKMAKNENNEMNS